MITIIFFRTSYRLNWWLNMKIVNFDHIVITVNNLYESKNFYHEVIGLPIKRSETTKDHVSLICGNSLLRLRQSDNYVNAIVAEKLIPGSFDFCLESADNINTIIGQLKNNKIKIELGPITKHGVKGKMTSVYFRDPDNNLVEICSYT